MGGLSVPPFVRGDRVSKQDETQRVEVGKSRARAVSGELKKVSKDGNGHNLINRLFTPQGRNSIS